MRITITYGAPIETLEVAMQLIAANAGLQLITVRKSEKSGLTVIFAGSPDDTGALGDIDTDEQALELLRKLKV